MISRRQLLAAAAGSALLGAGRSPKKRHPLNVSDRPRAMYAAWCSEWFTTTTACAAGRPTAIRAASPTS